MFPASHAGRPPARSMACSAAAVVDFPRVPVTATTCDAAHQRKNIVSSISMRAPASRATASAGASSGTAGLRTTISASRKSCRSCRPKDVAHALRPQLLHARGKLRRPAQVGHDQRRAMGSQELGDAQAAAVQPQTHHHHTPPSQRPRAVDRLHDWPARHGATPTVGRPRPSAILARGLSRQTLMTSRAPPI